jgi:phosphatidylserine decarboxylase
MNYDHMTVSASGDGGRAGVFSLRLLPAEVIPQLLRKFVAPIHPDGWKFVGASIVLALVLFVVWEPLGWIGVLGAAWCAYFFRDPWRVTPVRPGLVIAPADGLVVSIGPAVPPPELEMGPSTMTRIGIFLNVLDVHVNRVPMGGRIKRVHYRPGKFVSANLDKASEDNERTAISMTTDEGRDIAFVQVAGLVARRIICKLREGDQVVSGQRFGLIRFGSRTDVYLPPEWTTLAIVGQRMVGGETVIADSRAQEPARQGIEH